MTGETEADHEADGAQSNADAEEPEEAAAASTQPSDKNKKKKKKKKTNKAKLWHLKRQGEGAAALAGHKRVGPVY